MNIYMTEDEQIDQIKSWWNSYGNYLLTVITIVLFSVAAYQWWNRYEDKLHAQASTAYQSLIVSLAEKDNDVVESKANYIISNYPKLVYAQSALLVQAKQAVSKGDFSLAKQKLNLAIVEKQSDNLTQLARIRLSRINLFQKHYKEALSTLDVVSDSIYLPLIYETKGDIYLAMGNNNKAVDNYKESIKMLSNIDMSSPMLEMKLNEIKTV